LAHVLEDQVDGGNCNDEQDEGDDDGGHVGNGFLLIIVYDNANHPGRNRIRIQLLCENAIMSSRKNKDQLSLDENLFLEPVSDKSQTKPSRGRQPQSVVPGQKKRAPAEVAKQPFLPGLSRRGRPRSKNPVPATTRASNSRKRRLAVGVKRIELFLPPEIAADLELLTQHFRVPRGEVIARLVARAARRVKTASPAS